MKKAMFRGRECTISILRKAYPGERTAIQLFDDTGDIPVATATVNKRSEPLADDEVIIKDYAENVGMLESMVAAGVLYPTGRYSYIGGEVAPICKLVADDEG